MSCHHWHIHKLRWQNTGKTLTSHHICLVTTNKKCLSFFCHGFHHFVSTWRVNITVMRMTRYNLEPGLPITMVFWLLAYYGVQDNKMLFRSPSEIERPHLNTNDGQFDIRPLHELLSLSEIVIVNSWSCFRWLQQMATDFIELRRASQPLKATKFNFGFRIL